MSGLISVFDNNTEVTQYVSRQEQLGLVTRLGHLRLAQILFTVRSFDVS